MRTFVGACLLIGCHPTEPASKVAAPAQATPQPSVLAPPMAKPDHTESATEAPLAWGTRAAATGTLFPWIDGVCIHMETWPLRDSVAITFGNGQGGAFVRGAWDGPSVGIAIADPNTLRAIAPPDALFDVVGFGGSTAALWASVRQGNPRMGNTDDQLFAWNGGSWNALTKLPRDGASSYTRSAALLQSRQAEPLFLRYTSVSAQSSGSTSSMLAADGSRRSAPILAGWPKRDTLEEVTLARLDDGSVVGLHDGEVRFATSLGASSKTLAHGRAGALVARGTVAYLATPTQIFRVAATGLQPISGGHGRLLPLERGAYVLAPDGKTFALDGDTLQAREALPEPLSAQSSTASTEKFLSGAVADSDGVSRAWAVGKSGALYTFDGDHWKKVELPAAPFAVTGSYRAERVLVLGPDDVVVNARYIERGIGWSAPEPYRALLRSKRPSETLRCEDPLGGSVAETRFKSWPPRADDSCTTPFVTVFRDGWQSLFRTGGKYTELAPVVRPFAAAVTEIEAAGAKWAGVKVESAAKGRELALALTKKRKELRPEVVCGTPEKVLREVAVR